jgi:hypothetical protein
VAPGQIVNQIDMLMGRAKARFPDYSATPPELKISAGEWRRIEKAYGHALPSTLRQGIIEATKILKYTAIFTADRRIADVEERIKRIQKGAKALYGAFRGGQPSPSHWFGDLCIEAQFEPQFSTNPANKHVSNVSTLIKQIESLDVACTTALDYLDRTANVTPSERSIWDLWVTTLTSTLRENGLPTSVRKDSDKQKGHLPSPFVALIRELQKSLPPKYRPPFHSDEALGQAISRARR